MSSRNMSVVHKRHTHPPKAVYFKDVCNLKNILTAAVKRKKETCLKLSKAEISDSLFVSTVRGKLFHVDRLMATKTMMAEM